MHTISFQTFFVWTFKIVVDYWKFTMLLLCILWDDWPVFMISGSNEQLQKELEYARLKPGCHSWWISKIQSDTFEERYAIKFCFELGKNATEAYGRLQTVRRLRNCLDAHLAQNSLWQGRSCGLVYCPGRNATDPIWRVLASSREISSWTPLKPQHSNLNPNPNCWPINSDVLTSLLLPHLSSSLTNSLPSLNLLYHSKTVSMWGSPLSNVAYDLVIALTTVRGMF